jgi:signal peptidase
MVNPLHHMSTAARVVIWLALLGVILGWFLLFRPSSLGGPAHYILVSGESMEPTLHGGDLLLVREQGTYTTGDIVAYRVPEGDAAEGRIVVHRVAGGSAAEGFTMQGDNKEGPDFWHPSQDDIIGEMWFRVPQVAGLVRTLREPLFVGAVAAAVAVFLVLSGGQDKKRSPRPSPGQRSHVIRGRRPPGLSLRVVLFLLSGIGTALRFTRAHQGGGRRT